MGHSNGSGSNTIIRERYTLFGITPNNPTGLNDQGGVPGHIKDKATGLNKCNLCQMDFRNWTAFVHFLKTSVINQHKIHDRQARYYDPVIGRFLSIDSVDFMQSGNSDNFNRYSYAFNNSINIIDPDGRYGYWGGASPEARQAFNDQQEAGVKVLGGMASAVNSLGKGVKQELRRQEGAPLSSNTRESIAQEDALIGEVVNELATNPEARSEAFGAA